MSLITCCPACKTMFKVVPDQMKIADGWVRCGHCSDVFDAAAHLRDQNQDHDPIAPQQVVYGQPIQVIDDPGGSAVSSTFSNAVMSDEPVVSEVRPEVLEVTGTEAVATPTSDRLSSIDLPNPPFVLVRADTGESAVVPAAQGLPDEAQSQSDAVAAVMPVLAVAVLPSSAKSEPDLEPEPGTKPEPDESHEDVAFVRQARRQVVSQRPRLNIALALLATALAVLMVLQPTLHHRDALAGAQPGLQPWLEWLCRPMACSVGPPRQIEAIVVDNSSFNRLRSDTYRLNFTLKNQAATAVAMPSIELTLTDTQDQPVVRRVLTTGDTGITAPAIAAMSESTGSLVLNVAASGGTRIAGYRLLAFYP